MHYKVEHNNGSNWVHQYTVRGNEEKGMDARYFISLEDPLSQFIDEKTGCIYYATSEGQIRLVPEE